MKKKKYDDLKPGKTYYPDNASLDMDEMEKVDALWAKVILTSQLMPIDSNVVVYVAERDTVGSEA